MKYVECYDCHMDTNDWVTENREVDQDMWRKVAVHNDRRLCKKFRELHNRLMSVSGRDWAIQAAYENWQRELERAAQAKAALFESLSITEDDEDEGPKRDLSGSLISPNVKSTRVWSS